MSERLPRRQHAVKGPGPSRTAAGDAFTELVLEVLRLNGRLLAAGDAMARPAGQTSARWQVLASVEDEPATVADIARAFGLARQSVQRVADALVHDELAGYEHNPRHRRAKLLRITPAGRSALRSIQAAQRAWADALGAEMGEADLRQASAVLDRVRQAVTSHAPAP